MSDEATKTHELVADPAAGSTAENALLVTPYIPAIPGYTLTRVIDQGGMGIVYEAIQHHLNRTVAIKIIREFVINRPHQRKRFADESLTLAKLNHPNIIQIFEANEVQGRPYFVMKFVAGGSLSKQWKKVRKDATSVINTLLPVVRAVAHLHSLGILHRDLKPGNILFDNGTPLLADFGLARWLDEDGITQSRTLIGTYPYMATEMFDLRRPGKASFLTDQWALGVILYEGLTSRRPFESRDELDLVEQIEKAAPLPLNQHLTAVPGIDTNLEAIVLRTLAKNPKHRYASCEELAADLQRWLDGQEPQTVAEPIARQRATYTEPEPPQRRRRVLWGVLFALAAVGIGLAVIPRNRDGVPPTLSPAKPTIRERLIRGEEVVLIGEKGDPRELVGLVPGFNDGTMNLDKDGYFVFGAVRSAFLELSQEDRVGPDDELKGIRISAEVSHSMAVNPNSRVGIYSGRQGHPQSDGKICHIAYLNTIFSVAPSPITEGNPGKAESGCYWLRPHIADSNFYNRADQTHELKITRDMPSLKLPNFRLMQIELTRSTIVPTHEAKQFFVAKPLPFDQRTFIESLIRVNSAKWAFPVAQQGSILGPGLGLFALHGTGTFRNFKLIPVKP